MGIKPQPFLDVLEPSTNRYVARALWASDDGRLDDRAVKVRVRPNPPGGPARAAPSPAAPPPVIAAPLMPTLRQMPPRIMQAPLPGPTP